MSTTPSRGQKPEDQAMFQKFLELQNQKLKNEAKELQLKEKDIDNQSRYAEKLLSHQAEIEKKRPLENRKTITRVAYLISAIVVIVFIFFAFCLYQNKEDFLLKLIQILGYFVTTWIGWYAGKKSGATKKANSNVEEIID